MYEAGSVQSLHHRVACCKFHLFRILTRFRAHFVSRLQIWLFHPLTELVGLSTWQVPLPSWWTLAPQVAFFFVFEDMAHFFLHQALHWGPLYKHIHKIHHKYSAPFGLAAEYAHPAEVMILGTGTIAGPLLYCAFRHDLHIVTVYLWIVLRLFQAVDAHSGYGELVVLYGDEDVCR